MTNKRKLTIAFIVTGLIAILGFDLWVAGGAPGDTISEVMLTWTSSNPFRSFAAGLIIGIILGHLFFPQIVVRKKPAE